MNSTTNDTKEWHISQASLQNSIMAESSVNSHPNQIQHYPSIGSMDHQYAPNYPQSPIHPPVHHPSSSNFLSNGKSESDPRLPIMSLSQPGTPRPNQLSSPVTPKKPSYGTSSFHAAPYPHTNLNRKRGRNELFSTELGPFFSSTKPVDNLYALDRTTLLTVRIQAKMDRGFFLADNDWTCYRRNYFQVSGAFAVHGLNHYYSDQEMYGFVQVEGSFYPVRQFSLNISARVSNSDKKIELVQHTPKRDKGPQSTPSPKPIIPGGNLSMSSVGSNQSIVTFERIQFKTATANNGKRRAAQQYYVCLVDLYAEIEGNRRIKVASCQSAPLVVRGRSPGHYSDSKYENNLSMSSQQPNDDRYATPYPRPPITPPGVIGHDYGTHYPYPPYPTNSTPTSNYPHYNSIPGSNAILPPTPTSGPPSSTSQHPYILPGMTPDPSSSESSSPDLYQGEFSNGNNSNSGPNSIHTDNKLNHSQHYEDWNRGKPGHTSPVGYDQHNSYFSSNNSPYSSQNSPYSLPRKYSTPVIHQQHSS